MTDTLDTLRRQAKTLQKSYDAGDPDARRRVAAHAPRPDGVALKRADFLHVIAQEHDFPSWPFLKAAVEEQGMDRAARIQRLKIALAHGQTATVARLMAADPDLADGHFGLQVALLLDGPVMAALAVDPTLATRSHGPRSPILHLAFSRAIHIWPEREAAMLRIAEALVQNGADVNDAFAGGDGQHPLSALYGALGHADNMVLAQWLLDHGADPNDGESLYHATELGHHRGIDMLLAAGADPRGTNALLRAIDFDDVEAVRKLIDAGADPNEFQDAPVGGEVPFVIPTLHQAARRAASEAMCRTLLDAGADPGREYQWTTAYAFARVYGHRRLAALIEERGSVPSLSPEERLLARVADGTVPEGAFLDPAAVPPAYRTILHDLLTLPDRLAQIKSLVAVGVDYDRPDDMGLTPVQLAGWNGRPEAVSYFLTLRPDLSHVNGYGGTLLSTIIHGSENCPDRGERDHIACVRLVLEHGVALPGPAIRLAGEERMSAFLSDWAKRYPGQVVAA